jgi:hypothetical protein
MHNKQNEEMDRDPKRGNVSNGATTMTKNSRASSIANE